MMGIDMFKEERKTLTSKIEFLEYRFNMIAIKLD